MQLRMQWVHDAKQLPQKIADRAGQSRPIFLLQFSFFYAIMLMRGELLGVRKSRTHAFADR